MIQTLSDALAKQGYETLTPVQEAVTDPALEQADLLVSAQTGSGKTVGFGLAIAPTLLGEATHFGPASAPLALIIAPTRELAMQVNRELTWLYGMAGAVVTSCVGGMDTRTERRALDRGAHVVVATPGRLCDHIKRNNIDLSSIRAVVLDEADEMLDLGFREELEFILSEAPEDRRTLMFSATVPAAIAKLAKSYQRDAQRVATAGDTRQHSDIEYRAMVTNPRDIDNAIINVLRFYEAKNAIVFCNTRAAVARMTSRLTNRNFSVVALSGELTQSERTNALQSLRDGRARVCVATDVAARGIDLPNLELVIHADLPSNSDTLLHRSGRTGRAGRKGVSALIVPPKLRSKANRLIGGAKLKVEWAEPPSAAEVLAADETRLLADPSWTDPVPEDAQDIVARLTAEFTPEQLAAAFVNLMRARQSAPEELSEPGVRDEGPRKAFGPSVWFSISQGRQDGAEPRTLLPMVCNKGNLTKDDIGAIRIQPSHSFVEVLAASADAFVAAVGPDMVLEAGAKLTRLDAPPNLDRGPKPDRKPRGPKPDFKKPQRDKPRYDPIDAAPPAEAPRTREKPRAEVSDKPYKPSAAPKGKKPPKSHKTERSPMKPGAKPKPKSSPAPEGARPPRAKAVWTKENREAAKAERPAREGGDKRTDRTPTGKGGAPRDQSASKKRAADPSKRFVPPNKRGKAPGKGPNATPRRKP
ncbi:ATP-dependent RNA helicase DeaD [Roseobacter fucihabitans]|uniref:ATP-dependent RNA helicase DeaD n=1 Tax=Roseobacter fucihabitans TaxID=1537242 RepID=A0ABZ2BMB0_9RHOB|nr:DEAD/DEAH box helicase [Roseobacter litoralis]MBC6963538.1 ATP-dependent RNA helicase DeaD [Roseobacter litoralis]